MAASRRGKLPDQAHGVRRGGGQSASTAANWHLNHWRGEGPDPMTRGVIQHSLDPLAGLRAESGPYSRGSRQTRQAKACRAVPCAARPYPVSQPRGVATYHTHWYGTGAGRGGASRTHNSHRVTSCRERVFQDMQDRAASAVLSPSTKQVLAYSFRLGMSCQRADHSRPSK